MNIFKKIIIAIGALFVSSGISASVAIETQTVPEYSVAIRRADETPGQKFKFEYAKNETTTFVIGTSSEFNFKVVQVDPTATLERVRVITNNSNFRPELVTDSSGSAISKTDYFISYNGKDLGKVEFELILAYVNDDGKTTEDQDRISFRLIEQQKTVWDWVMGVLGSAVGTTLSITALITILWRSALKIYDKGKNDKKELVTKAELKDFEGETRKDMRGYVRQITETVTDSSMRIIEKELKPLDDIMQTANEMKIMKVNIDNTLKSMNEKYDDIKQIGDTVRSLSSKVTRIEYGKENAGERRTER